MKLLFWTDPNENITVLEPTGEATDEYGHRYGSDLVVLKKEHLDALLGGKMLAWNDSEYSTFILLDRELVSVKEIIST